MTVLLNVIKVRTSVFFFFSIVMKLNLAPSSDLTDERKKLSNAEGQNQ